MHRGALFLPFVNFEITPRRATACRRVDAQLCRCQADRRRVDFAAPYWIPASGLRASCSGDCCENIERRLSGVFMPGVESPSFFPGTGKA